MFRCTSLEVALPSLAQLSLVQVVALETVVVDEIMLTWQGGLDSGGRQISAFGFGSCARKIWFFCLKNIRSHQTSLNVDWEYFQQKTFYSETTERNKILIWNMLIFFNPPFTTNVFFFPWIFFFCGLNFCLSGFFCVGISHFKVLW